MIHTKQNIITALVVSLLVVVISLPGAICLAAVAPAVKAMPPVREGMLTPARIALEPAGSYWVTDYRTKLLLKYNVYGQVEKQISTSGNPFAITVRPSGDLVVTQGKYAAIVNTVTGQETRFGDGVISKGNGVAVDEGGVIYITDALQNKVHAFGPYGGYIASYGGYGVPDSRNPAGGLFFVPTAVVYEKEKKQIAVVDSMNGRVQFFDTAPWTFNRSIGLAKQNDAAMDFVAPQGLAFEYDATGKLKRMYVTDAWKNAIQVIDPVVPKFLSLIGAGSISAGSYPLGILGGVEDWQVILPTDAVFDPMYSRLMVATGNSSIQVFGIDGGKSPVGNSPHYLTINPAPLNTSLSSYTISGTVKPGSDVKVTTNTGALVSPITYAASGARQTWSANVAGLALGANNIAVTAVDVASNVLTKEVAVVYSLSVPSLTIATPSGTVTKQSSYVVTGTVDEGCAVTLKNMNTGSSIVVTPENGSWSAAISLVSNAANNIVATATRQGSSPATTSVNIVSDNTAPTINLSALPEGSYSSGTLYQNFTGYVQDANPGDNIVYSVNNAPAFVVPMMPGGLFSFVAPLQSGENNIQVQATDKAGNVSSPVARKIFSDQTKPTIVVDSSFADNSYTASATATVTGKVAPVDATISITNANNGAAGVVTYPSAGSWSATVPVVAGPNGLNTIIITATSGKNEASVKRSLTLEAAKPGLAINSPSADVYTKEASIIVSGTLTAGTDGFPVLKATVNSTPVPDSDLLVDSTGHFSFPVVFAALSEEKVYSIQVLATDKAGNSLGLVALRNIIHDNTQPNLTLDDQTSGQPVVISGTVDASARVSVKDGDVSYPVAYDNSAIPVKWTSQISQAYSSGTIQITATDPAGNAKVLGLE